MKRIILLIILFIGVNLHAQEFKCNVTVNAASIRGSNKQMFKTLQRAIQEFVNKNRWTDKRFKEYERIQCDIILNIKEYNQKKGSVKSELYFRSYRPVFKSDYQTLLLNLIDKNFEFTYREFEKLDFNLELFENNLTSTIAFYLYIALGEDFNSSKENAGVEFLKKAEIIQTSAEQNGIKGWNRDNKNNSKGDLIVLLLDEQSKFFQKAIYTYHRWGLDMMADKQKLGKNNIITALNYISKLKAENKNSDYLIKIFFDAKSDEIVQIFSAGPSVNVNFVTSKLRNLAPNYDHKWNEIQKLGKQYKPSVRSRNPMNKDEQEQQENEEEMKRKGKH
jgi:hypothetical protein